VAPLNAAVALEQMQDVAVVIGEDLHLDMTGTDDSLLQVHGRVAERCVGLTAGRLDRLAQTGELADSPHPSAAATGNRLDEQWKSHLLRGSEQFRHRRRRRRRLEHGQPCVPGSRDCPRLVARQLQDTCAGADKRDAGRSACVGEIGVF